jgi:hypothetical protein
MTWLLPTDNAESGDFLKAFELGLIHSWDAEPGK